ncbi:MAG: hypothetical protein CFE29_03805 [Bradyrhizobiaceae bacterium PARB1]|jgi:hypothetical protein|nr:MAG: hypothetical protein CFE29_03805 [Bradyrhizobiaceae bacterium PARB1]
MSNSLFSPRGFGYGAFLGISAVAGGVASAGVVGVQAATRRQAEIAQRNRVARIIRRDRAELREVRKDLAISRAESAIRLWHIKKLLPATRAVR